MKIIKDNRISVVIRRRVGAGVTAAVAVAVGAATAVGDAAITAVLTTDTTTVRGPERSRLPEINALSAGSMDTGPPNARRATALASAVESASAAEKRDTLPETVPTPERKATIPPLPTLAPTPTPLATPENQEPEEKTTALPSRNHLQVEVNQIKAIDYYYYFQ